ncbi:hypothetical protein NLI96_g8789 [Meripilus lineatus]|uniref:chitin deacetylase n=1 Tax=Meripilus lineatus TaxID=2056292 RepID=A0AAD5UWT4_9APHY|nr:hypothetical protein NLI96_g8789 [Physisporinus lineatus]
MSFLTKRFLALAALSYLCSLTLASYLPREDHHDHDHSSDSLPAGNWYQPDHHPVRSLFKRATHQTDGQTYPAVGSAQWAAAYPTGKADTSKLPQEWVDALNAAVAAGKIPNIPPTTLVKGNPTYPNNLDPNSDTVCSTTVQCNKNPDVWWDAPPGVFATSFDDGPLPTSDKLYQFLQQNNEHATHFFIGTNILANPKEFTTAFDTLNDDIAVHTWTHPYMTTLTNLEVLGELGWTMQIIHDSTGGRVPAFWRPPYGDSDNRVIAIASEVFGMTTCIWNKDTDDWSIGEGGSTTTVASAEAAYTKWLAGPKTPGLMVLEHELSVATVQIFMDMYPKIKASGWQTMSLARINGSAVYQNAADSIGPVVLVKDITDADVVNASSSATPSSSSASASASSATGNTTSQSQSSSDKAAATGTVKTNGAFSFVLDSAQWQPKGIFATVLTLGLSLMAFS